MNKNYMSELLTKVKDADKAGFFDERRKQLEFCQTMGELIREVIQNEFNVNTITALIQISNFKSKDENLTTHLNLLGLKNTEPFRNKLLKNPRGLRGITGAGRNSVNGDELGPSKLECIRQFFNSVNCATDREKIKDAVREYEAKDIKYVTDGIYSPFLAYLRPDFCPIANGSTKEYYEKLGWDGEDYCSLMDFTYPLLENFTEKSFFLLDAVTRENVVEFIHGAEMTNLPNVWVEKTKLDRRTTTYPYTKFLTSPQRGADGRDTYSLMREVKPGDLVIHLLDNEKITGVSRVHSDLQVAGTEHFLELQDYVKLEPEFKREDFLENRLYANRLLKLLDTEFTFFYNSKLELNQGAYLTQAPPELVRIYNKIYKAKANKFLPHLDSFGDVLTSIVSSEGFDLKSVRLNRIYNGPPGTGKTHRVIEDALKVVLTEAERARVDWDNRDEVIRLFDEYKTKGFIEMVTFHQSYSYEDFIEGIRPVLDPQSKGVTYKVEDGVFKTFVHKSRRSNKKIPHSLSGPIDPNRVFKVSLGDTTLADEADIYIECIRNGRIAIGYGQGEDFNGANSRDAVKEKLKGVVDSLKDTDYNITSVNYLKNVLKKGDLVIVSDGNHYFRAIGVVSSDKYIFEPDSRFQQQREVDWLVLFDGSMPADAIIKGQFSQASIYKIDPERINLPGLHEILKPETVVRNSVFIIDEINRGNISKIFGELLTLLEEDKREGNRNRVPLTLPYSKEAFTLPRNLYVFGTMNTTDRSIAIMDLALRRRFEFVEVMPSSKYVNDNYGLNLKAVFNRINEKITLFLGRDFQVGHSYFMNENIETVSKFKMAWYKSLIPLLMEYFHDEPLKLKAILGDFVTIAKPIVAIEGFGYLCEEGLLELTPEIDDEHEFIEAVNRLNA